MTETIEIQVISDYPEGSILVCVPAGYPSRFHDDMMGNCADCGGPIRFRPHAVKAPIKICIECIGKRIADEPGNIEMAVTEKTAEEVKDVLKNTTTH